jgi:hypothetical protein
MAVIIRSTYIEAPADGIFDYLVDVERHLEWSGELSYGLETLKKVTPGSLRAGSVFKSTGRLSSMVGVEDTSVVTEIKPPRYLAWDTISSGALQENTFRWAYTIEPRREGTRLTYSLEERHFNPKPIQLWFPPLLWLVDRKIFGREMEGALRRIKIALEK